MSGQPPQDGNRDALMHEAATWFARLRGPDAEAHQPAFETWLRRGAVHRAAYNRAAEIFAMGKMLAEPALADKAAPGAAPAAQSSRAGRFVLVAAFLALLAGAGWLALGPGLTGLSSQRPAIVEHQERRQISTDPGQGRTMRLADGSHVALAPGSRLEIEMDASERRLTLLSGRARFQVSHESRPFRVHAGGGVVTARGTVFDVILRTGTAVTVHLIEGAVDVATPAAAPRPSAPVRRMSAGQTYSFAALADGVEPGSAIGDHEDISLAALVAAAARDGQPAIRLADPALGERRVSGRFRTDDPALLAQRLAILFDLSLEATPGGDIVLRPR